MLREFLKALQAPFVGRGEEARVVALTLLAREHTVFIGEPGCVSGDTIVSASDGRLFYIDDVARGLTPGVYYVDFWVFPHARADELHVYEVLETAEVITRRGFSIRVTLNHPLMTDRGWVKAGRLKPGDRVRVFTKIPSPRGYVKIPRDVLRKALAKQGNGSVDAKQPRLVDEELAELLGIFTARGFLKPQYVGFNHGSRELRELVERLVSGVFNVDVDRVAELDSRRIRAGRVGTLRLNSQFMADLFKWLNGYSSRRVSRWILLSPKAVSAAFLRGLFEAAGEVSNQGCSVVLKDVDPGILRAVQVLLLRHGVLSAIEECVPGGTRKSVNKYFTLKVSGLENLKRFVSEVGFISRRKREEAESCISLLLNKGGDPSPGSSTAFDEVREVRIVRGLTRVYDFHIPATHSFFTGGLLSHNTAKSAIVRRAAELLNARFFKYLLTRFTEPAELFGPLDIKALEDGKYVRLSRGKLPEAEIAFLDEIFKANSAILNALNSLLQERVLYDGYTELVVPLWSLFGASNEVPEEPEVAALYDRFVIRHFVRPVAEDLWRDLLNKSWEIERELYYQGCLGGGKVMDMGDLRKFHKLVLSVNLEPVKTKLVKLFAVFESRGVHVTDRRKGKSLKLIAANAVLEGRGEAQESDLIVLKYVVPKDWDELEKVNTILSEELKTPYRYLRELEEIKTNVREVMNYVLSLQNIESRFVEMRFRQILRDLEITRDRVVSLMLESRDPGVERLAGEVIAIIDSTADTIRRRLR